MANKMNNVTTLGDKERMHALLADNVDDDFDVDELINVDVQINPNNPTIENTPAITHNIVFLQFIQPISCNTENLMSLADLHPEADIVKILQLRLFLSAPLSASTLVVTLNTVFKLCFSNEEQISFYANRCLRDLLYCGEQWLCSSSSIQEVLSSMGTSSHISASRKDSTQWTTSLDTVKHSVHHICMCNQAMRRMRLLLELIHLSYSNFQATAK